MVETLDVMEVAARLPELVQRVAKGDYEVFISKSGVVVAKLVAAGPNDLEIARIKSDE